MLALEAEITLERVGPTVQALLRLRVAALDHEAAEAAWVLTDLS